MAKPTNIHVTHHDCVGMTFDLTIPTLSRCRKSQTGKWQQTDGVMHQLTRWMVRDREILKLAGQGTAL